MSKYRIEFNTSGFYYGQGIWECIDEFDNVEANNIAEAIELCKDWWIENADDPDIGLKDVADFAWRASEIKYDEDGYLQQYEWISDVDTWVFI